MGYLGNELTVQKKDECVLECFTDGLRTVKTKIGRRNMAEH